MTVPTDVRKVGDALVASGKATFAEAGKPLLAWIGANRAVLIRTRELPEVVQGQARQLQDLLGRLPTQARSLPDRAKSIPGRAKTLPVVLPASAGVLSAQAKGLAERAQGVQSAATTVAGGVVERLAQSYVDLVTRGAEVVGTARREPATREAVAQAKTARSRAKAATTSARSAGKAAAKSATTTADKTTS